MGTSGLEPPTSRLSGVRSNHLSYAPKLKTWYKEQSSKRVTRIELATTAWKAVVLPLNYTRIVSYWKMARDGIEPPTHGASIHCSTNWAIKAKWRSRRESNPRSPAWQAGVITATPRDLTLILNSIQMVTRTGFEPVLPPWKGGVLTTWPTGQ